MKGKKARSGNFHPRYEGGQTPLQRRVPKSGFSKRAFSFQPSSYVNLSKILYCIRKGKIDPTKRITIRDLVESRAVTSAKNSVRLLGRGGSELPSAKMGDEIQPIPPLNIEVSSASKQAIDFVKASGGTVTCVYRTPLTMRYHLRPDKWSIPPNEPLTPPKKAYSMERLRKQGAEVVYTPTEWFKNKNKVKSIINRFEERETRAEKLRKLGEGVRIKPMLTRRVNYFAGKSKKKKKSRSQVAAATKAAKLKEKGKGKVDTAKEDKGKENTPKREASFKQDAESKDVNKQRKAQSVDAKSEKIEKKEAKSEQNFEGKKSKKAVKKEKDTKDNSSLAEDNVVNSKATEKNKKKEASKNKQNGKKETNKPSHH